MRVLRTVLWLMTGAIAITGCGSTHHAAGQGSSTSTSRPNAALTTSPGVASDEPDPKAELIMIGDLPSGWTVTNSAQPASVTGCAGIRLLLKQGEASSAEASF